MKTKSRRLNIGSMKQRVEVQSYSVVADGLGGNTRTWSTLSSVWANITPINGSESLEVGGLKSKTKFKILTRYKLNLGSDSFINPLMRIVYDGKNYNIQYAVNKGEEGAITEMVAIAE